MQEYEIPTAVADDPGSPPRAPGTLVRLRTPGARAAARLRRRRRLAYVDSHFPWARSGFRYDEALEIHRRRPDTLFFALHPCTDDFPARVHPLSDFPSVAPAAGVTDVHVVFLNLALAVLGIPSGDQRALVPGEREDLSLAAVLARWRMRSHVTVYPGGGCLPGIPAETVRRLGEGCSTIFTSVPEVQAAWPAAVPTRVPVPTGFYEPGGDRGDRLRLVFVGDDKPRKGLSVLLEALPDVQAAWTLDVIGPHTRHAEVIARWGERIKTHGWLEPERLRGVLQQCNVIVAPATRDLASDGYGDVGMVDGFPTTAALIGMLSGCCLVGSNPGLAPTSLTSDDWVAVPERDPSALASALDALARDPHRRRRTAARGRHTVVSAFDVVTVVEAKLEHMGLAR